MFLSPLSSLQILPAPLFPLLLSLYNVTGMYVFRRDSLILDI